MPFVSRRNFLASGTATGVAFAQKSAPSDVRDAQAPPERRLLSGRYSVDRVAAALLPAGGWKPYPAASDRGAWESLPADVRSGMIEAGQSQLGAEWPIPKATRFLEYV